MSLSNEELINKIETLDESVLAGDLSTALELMQTLKKEKLDSTTQVKLENIEIRILINQGDFETAIRRLNTFIKKKHVKSGTRVWVERILMRAYINQSLGHSKKAEKDLKTIQETDTTHGAEIDFNLGVLSKDKGLFDQAESHFRKAMNSPEASTELKTRCSLAVAIMRSLMDQGNLSDLTATVLKNGPRWGGWMEVKNSEIINSQETFRSGDYGTALKELFHHVKESDESGYTHSQLLSRIVLSEALIDIGDYMAAKKFAEEAGLILKSTQHSSLKNFQPQVELLWYRADVKLSNKTDQYLEALDRLEIILAVVAKYPKPPGPAPFWLTIAEIQTLLGQTDQALRSLKKAWKESENNGSVTNAVSAGIEMCSLQWSLLTEEEKHQGTARNQILAETTRLFDLLSTIERPELSWRVHYLRGRIFLESGEPYPSREELKEAARIAGSILHSIDDPSLQKVYRMSSIRTDAFLELQDYIETKSEDLMKKPFVPEKATDGQIVKGEDGKQLQDVLNSLFMIHSSENLEVMFNNMLGQCLQILDADQGKIETDQHVCDGQSFELNRSNTQIRTHIVIPDKWKREASKGMGVFSYILNADDSNPDTRYCLVAGMKKRSKKYGIIYVDRIRSKGVFSPAEVTILNTIVNAASVAVSSLSIRSRLSKLTEQLRSEIVPKFKNIIGESPAMNSVFMQMQRVAPADIPVLIQGATGTGKDLVARNIHDVSHRADAPFVHLDCSSIPETLLESELFGISDGIATGVESRVGLLEYANGGTILLDEIGDIPLSTQAKLLRVLQEREFEPVGSDKIVKVDIRIISTTSRDLKKKISDGDMREDFYYRVSGITINLPPLCKRPGDILLMARTFLQKYNRDFKKAVTGFSPELIDAMTSYKWPGNVRELDHLIRKAVLFAQGKRLTLSEMDIPVVQRIDLTLKDAVTAFENEVIKEALEITLDDVATAASVLEISQQRIIDRNQAQPEFEDRN